MGERKIKVIIILLLIVASFISTLAPVWDPDCFWHLAFGRYIFENRSLVEKEPFSFIREGEETVDLSWFPHLLFYSTYKYFGFRGCEILVSLFSILAMIFIILTIQEMELSLTSLSLYFTLFFTAFIGRFKLRPEGVSLICFSALIYLLMKYRKDGLKSKYPFILLFFIWTQIHPSWIYGLILIPIFIFEKQNWLLKKILFKDWFFLFLAPIFSLFFNPYFYKPVIFPFNSFLVMRGDSSFRIAEWGASPFNLSTIPFLLISVITLLFTLYQFFKKKETILPLLISGIQTIFLFLWVRYSSFAFIALAPYATKLFEEIISKIPKFQKAITVITLLLFILPFISIFQYRPTERILKVNYPEEEVKFLLKNKISGNIHHTFVAGGFIEFATYPYSKSFIDGRYFDFEKTIKEYESANKDITKYKNILKKYPFEIAIVPYSEAKVLDPKSAIKRNAEALIFEKEEWAPIFYGPYGTVFVKREEKYYDKIEKFEFKILFPYDEENIKRETFLNAFLKEELKKEIERARKTGARFLND